MSRDGSERSRVFREARTAEAWAGMEKLAADALVHANGACDVVHITTYLVAEIGDFVYERNFRGEKCICGVLRQFGCFERRDHKRCFDQIERPVKILHDRNSFFVTTADDDTVRAHEVVNRCAFAKKLGDRKSVV